MPHADLANTPQTGQLSLTVFIVGSALLYAGAMIAMKFWGQASPALLIGVIALLMAGGVWFEIGALQTERLAMIYVLILGIECVLIALVSTLWFGETFTVRELAGGALIIAGTAMAWV